jgi:hypothetical protein
VDGDGDGVEAPRDCDDSDPAIEESFDFPCETECGAGTARCRRGYVDACDAPVPGPEDCNGDDDDCDGETDEGLVHRCSEACGGGEARCVSGTWTGCLEGTIAAETCNAADDDCDGFVDEDADEACSSDCGDGVRTCESGVLGFCSARTPLAAESCNGADDDCDGTIDEEALRSCEDPVCGMGDESCYAGEFLFCDARCHDHMNIVCDFTMGGVMVDAGKQGRFVARGTTEAPFCAGARPTVCGDGFRACVTQMNLEPSTDGIADHLHVVRVGVAAAPGEMLRPPLGAYGARYLGSGMWAATDEMGTVLEMGRYIGFLSFEELDHNHELRCEIQDAPEDPATILGTAALVTLEEDGTERRFCLSDGTCGPVMLVRDSL